MPKSAKKRITKKTEKLEKRSNTNKQGGDFKKKRGEKEEAIKTFLRGELPRKATKGPRQGSMGGSQDWCKKKRAASVKNPRGKNVNK